jgi:C4-dicarboxylate-specific signal transduction histidine kinase
MSDKSKVLQILINLIQNAKDSFLFEDYEFPKKTIVVKVWKIDVENPKVNIEVSDNGIGISSENLKKVFMFGFTTKVKGHGFGLHSSAISAKELGGALLVRSEGLGRGSAFSLALPDSEETLKS